MNDSFGRNPAISDRFLRICAPAVWLLAACIALTALVAAGPSSLAGPPSTMHALLPDTASGLVAPDRASFPMLPDRVDGPVVLDHIDTPVLPLVLSRQDEELYREIFALQERGKWKAANKRIAKLESRLLLGHVMYQRYMHPTAYRSKYKELKAWMASYADHPGARRIYRLALKRRPANASRPKQPINVKMSLSGERAIAPYRSTKKLSKSKRRRARAIKRQVRRNVLRTRLTVSEQLLASSEARRLLDSVEIDEARGQVAAAWFYYGKPKRAYRLASKAATRSGRQVPLALWIAGLSAWRLGDVPAAVGHFETLAQSARASTWLKSAGAYWAARGNLRLKKPAEVSRWLAIAADAPRTFYGIVAQRALGMEIVGPEQRRSLTRRETDSLMANPAARRALALLQVDRRDLAESELKRLDGDGDGSLKAALLALNDAAGFPAYALRLARSLVTDSGRWSGGRFDSALYPIPPWEPAEGFKVDRALIYAFVRQESAFKPRAKSRDGARGLMQLLPSTANYVVRKRRFRGSSRNKLFDPQTNLDVGQRYIHYLLRHRQVSGDLFRLTAAYNAGPGNLAKWRRKMTDVHDPLMFLESLPSRETRLFIERVLANLWIYRSRLGQPLPSLDDVVAGDWPSYTPLDRPLQSAAGLPSREGSENYAVD